MRSFLVYQLDSIAFSQVYQSKCLTRLPISVVFPRSRGFEPHHGQTMTASGQDVELLRVTFIPDKTKPSLAAGPMTWSMTEFVA